MELPDYMVILCLTFEDLPYFLPQQLHPQQLHPHFEGVAARCAGGLSLGWEGKEGGKMPLSFQWVLVPGHEMGIVPHGGHG